MKQLLAFGLLVLVVSASGIGDCRAQAANATTTFDGFYEKPVITEKSQGCPDLNNLPHVSVSNGLAIFQAPTVYFSGNVTPEGKLSMKSTTGQKFEGQIDPQFVLTAAISGPNCSYNVTWTRAG